jgi:hypothetical protein
MHARRCKGVGWLIKKRNSKEKGSGREVASGFFKNKQRRRTNRGEKKGAWRKHRKRTRMKENRAA